MKKYKADIKVWDAEDSDDYGSDIGPKPQKPPMKYEEYISINFPDDDDDDDDDYVPILPPPRRRRRKKKRPELILD